MSDLPLPATLPSSLLLHLWRGFCTSATGLDHAGNPVDGWVGLPLEQAVAMLTRWSLRWTEIVTIETCVHED